MSAETKIETRVNQFQDTEKRNWVVRVSVQTLRDVREFLGVDLNDAIDPTKDLIDRLSNDVILALDIIYLACKKQMDAKDVSADDFSAAISGDTIEQAGQALINAIIDFFPSSKTGPIRESLAIRDKLVTRIKDKAMKTLTEVTEEDLEQAAEKLINQFGQLSQPAPESSE